MWSYICNFHPSLMLRVKPEAYLKVLHSCSLQHIRLVWMFGKSKHKYNRTVVVQNKSSLLLKIIFTNTQTLQLFTKKVKTEIIYASY